MKDAVMFLVDYMSRPDAKGEQWGDHKYHIFPSIPPELYGLQPDFKFNYDTQIDIALSKFIFKAYLEAIQILKIGKQEKNLAGQVNKILSGMPARSIRCVISSRSRCLWTVMTVCAWIRRSCTVSAKTSV